MRIRTIKPEFWHHPVMARLPDDVQLLALGLLSMADDEGYFRADVEIVRGEVAPFRENLARVRECLAELSRVGWVALVRSPDGGEIGKVVTWEKHQRVDHPSPSKLKAYFLASNSRESREDSRGEQGTGKGKEGNGEIPSLEEVSKALSVANIPEEFIRQRYAKLSEDHGWFPNGRIIDWQARFRRHWEDFGREWMQKHSQAPAGQPIVKRPGKIAI